MRIASPTERRTARIFGALFALAFVTSIIGAISLLSVATLRADFASAGAAAGTLTVAGLSLVAIHDWTFLLGPGWIVGLGNGLILGYLMYRSGLVPRRMAMLGLIGGPLILISGTAVLFNVIEAGSSWQVLATIPEFFWELSLGIYLIVKGFRRSPIIGSGPATVVVNDGTPALATVAR